jgi:hypothetical protein
MVDQSLKDGFMSFIRTRIAAARQTPTQIFQRVPGERLLSGPLPALPEAQEEWQFALLSVAAYGRSAPEKAPLPAGRGMLRTLWDAVTRKEAPPALPNVDANLKALGWIRWDTFPDPILQQEMKQSHLRAEVWENAGQGKVVAAFGGTVFTSGKDWKSNLRWFLPKHEDEYTAIVQRFAPDFAAAFAGRMATPDGAHLKDVTVYSTGHSLGGGLAQQFAYSLPDHPPIQKVAQVYAFDPSPVTGFYSVKREIRDRNKTGLKITRSYERGEVLALLRSFTSLLNKPSAKDAEIRGVRFSLFYTLSPLAGHSIIELAQRMEMVARNLPLSAPGNPHR